MSFYDWIPKVHISSDLETGHVTKTKSMLGGGTKTKSKVFSVMYRTCPYLMIIIIDMAIGGYNYVELHTTCSDLWVITTVVSHTARCMSFAALVFSFLAPHNQQATHNDRGCTKIPVIILCSICFTLRPSLRPSDVNWRHRSGSTLAHVMACCLTTPSHYLNRCWLIISKVKLHSSDGNFTRDTSVSSE